ncbi:MAG: preprotein translocase subunit SecD, partial [Thermodesulfobacteriota bacterium]|nr:preprotein translocase subunit SecD [Thermodesulfobacteriota bacterium]
MAKNLGWRAAIMSFLIFMAFMYLTPSLTDDLPPWWSGFLPQEKIHLGLDLQGGIHLILEVEAQKAVESNLERVVEDIKHDLRKKKTRYLELKRHDSERIVLVLMRESDRGIFEELVETHYQDFKIEAGEPVEKGFSLQLVLGAKAKDQIMQMATEQALETIRNRIDQFGVSEPDIRPQEGHRILIQLPGVKDPERAIELIGKTARLEFKLVDDENNLDEALKGNIPPGREILYQLSFDKQTGHKAKVPFLLKKRTLLTGEYLTNARVQIDNQYNEPYVSLSFNARGAKLFEKITGANIEKRLAIVLDNNVYSAPVIRDRIPGGKAQITGRFTMDEARDLAIVLRAGALPAPVKI